VRITRLALATKAGNGSSLGETQITRETSESLAKRSGTSRSSSRSAGKPRSASRSRDACRDSSSGAVPALGETSSPRPHRVCARPGPPGPFDGYPHSPEAASDGSPANRAHRRRRARCLQARTTAPNRPGSGIWRVLSSHRRVRSWSANGLRATIAPCSPHVLNPSWSRLNGADRSVRW